MRRSLALLCVLLLLSLGGIIGAHMYVNSAREAVTMTPEVISGSEDAALGLNVTEKVGCGTLLWDISRDFSSSPAVNTKFGYYARSFPAEAAQPETYLSMSFMGMPYMSGSDKSSESQGMTKPLADAAAGTEPGKSRTITVKLKKYYDYFPIYSGAGFADDALSMTEEDSAELNKTLSDYFRIPVPEDFTVGISLSKDSSGGIVDNGYSEFSDIQVMSAGFDGGVYFVFNSAVNGRGPAADRLDTSLVSGGYGIYRMDYTTDADGMHAHFITDSLKTVFPLDSSTDICSLSLSDDGRQLLLIYFLDNSYRLKVIGTGSWKELQDIKLIDCGGGDGLWGIYIKDDFIAAMTYKSKQLAVFQKCSDGVYDFAFQCHNGNILDYTYNLSENDSSGIAWDGKRLAIAGYILSDDGYCSSYVAAVYTSDGLAYLGKYHCSLDAGPVMENGTYVQNRCIPAYGSTDSISVRWS